MIQMNSQRVMPYGVRHQQSRAPPRYEWASPWIGATQVNHSILGFEYRGSQHFSCPRNLQPNRPLSWIWRNPGHCRMIPCEGVPLQARDERPCWGLRLVEDDSRRSLSCYDMQSFGPFYPELFCCRDISIGADYLC